LDVTTTPSSGVSVEARGASTIGERTLVLNRVVVVALVVVAASLAYVAGRFDWPPGGRQLVSSGVQSVTTCGEHPGAFNLMGIPGTDVGIWGWEKKDGCYIWYHYAEGEE
jgi:hypothetical protein